MNFRSGLPPLRNEARVDVTANGGGDNDDPNNGILAANRSSCRGYRARNSGSSHSDRTGRTSPDWKLRAAPRSGWQARIAER